MWLFTLFVFVSLFWTSQCFFGEIDEFSVMRYSSELCEEKSKFEHNCVDMEFVDDNSTLTPPFCFSFKDFFGDVEYWSDDIMNRRVIVKREEIVRSDTDYNSYSIFKIGVLFNTSQNCSLSNEEYEFSEVYETECSGFLPQGEQKEIHVKIFRSCPGFFNDGLWRDYVAYIVMLSVAMVSVTLICVGTIGFVCMIPCHSCIYHNVLSADIVWTQITKSPIHDKIKKGIWGIFFIVVVGLLAGILVYVLLLLNSMLFWVFMLCPICLQMYDTFSKWLVSRIGWDFLSVDRLSRFLGISDDLARMTATYSNVEDHLPSEEDGEKKGSFRKVKQTAKFFIRLILGCVDSKVAYSISFGCTMFTGILKSTIIIVMWLINEVSTFIIPILIPYSTNLDSVFYIENKNWNDGTYILLAAFLTAYFLLIIPLVISSIMYHLVSPFRTSLILCNFKEVYFYRVFRMMINLIVLYILFHVSIWGAVREKKSLWIPIVKPIIASVSIVKELVDSSKQYSVGSLVFVSKLRTLSFISCLKLPDPPIDVFSCMFNGTKTFVTQTIVCCSILGNAPSSSTPHEFANNVNFAYLNWSLVKNLKPYEISFLRYMLIFSSDNLKKFECEVESYLKDPKKWIEPIPELFLKEKTFNVLTIYSRLFYTPFMSQRFMEHFLFKSGGMIQEEARKRIAYEKHAEEQKHKKIEEEIKEKEKVSEDDSNNNNGTKKNDEFVEKYEAELEKIKHIYRPFIRTFNFFKKEVFKEDRMNLESYKNLIMAETYDHARKIARINLDLLDRYVFLLQTKENYLIGYDIDKKENEEIVTEVGKDLKDLSIMKEIETLKGKILSIYDSLPDYGNKYFASKRRLDEDLRKTSMQDLKELSGEEESTDEEEQMDEEIDEDEVVVKMDIEKIDVKNAPENDSNEESEQDGEEDEEDEDVEEEEGEGSSESDSDSY